MRYDDSPDLFGSGVGHGTSGGIDCEWCGTVHEEDDVIIDYTHFADKVVCYCCFEAIETEILRRMGDLLPWYLSIVSSSLDSLTKNKKIAEDINNKLRRIRKGKDCKGNV